VDLRVIGLIFFPLFTGCGLSTGFHLDGKPSCAQKNYTWTDDLTRHLLNGRRDATFDYDPDTQVVRRINGSYDLLTGDFSWKERYHADHFRKKSEVVGYGYADSNGDLDIEYALQVTDVLGVQTTSVVRLEREHCKVTKRVTDEDGELTWEFGKYWGEAYNFRTEQVVDGAPWTVYGVDEDDGSFTRTLDWATSSESYGYEEQGDGEGYSRRDWEQDDGRFIVGYQETWLSGRTHEYYTVEGATWDYTLNYEGNGEGTYTEDDSECELTFVAHECYYDCGGGSTGNC